MGTMSKYLRNHLNNLNEKTISKHYTIVLVENKFVVSGTTSQIYVEYDKKTGELIASNLYKCELTDKIWDIIKKMS